MAVERQLEAMMGELEQLKGEISGQNMDPASSGEYIGHVSVARVCFCCKSLYIPLFLLFLFWYQSRDLDHTSRKIFELNEIRV